MQIWKYELEITDRQTFKMRIGAKFLTVQMQYDKPMLWVLCDENEAASTRTIAIYGTGHLLPAYPGDYIGTFQMAGGGLVWHVFEVTPG